MKQNLFFGAILATSLGLVGCGSDGDSATGASSSTSPGASSSSSANSSDMSSSSSSSSATNIYAFADPSGVSTVSYTGQIARHAMIEHIKILIGDVPKSAEPTVDGVALEEALLAVYNNEGGFLDNEELLMASTSDAEYLQITYGDISEGKNLVGKTAGEDSIGALDDNTDNLLSPFIGWDGLPENTKPRQFIEKLFADLHATVTDPMAEGNTKVLVGEFRELQAISKAYVSADGIDYQQLIQKFLLMSVGFSQVASDYLSPKRDYSAELSIGGGANYSTAEHHFDEGFGYFGASENYLNLSDEEINVLVNDTNNDGSIDLTSEYSWGQSVNCAKRDIATASNGQPTNFTQDAMEAFIAGRTIIAEATANAELTTVQKQNLDAALQQAVGTWEKCIAATVVHYINEVKNDAALSEAQTAYGSTKAFENYAKHWAEMKGFALGLQFSPYSPFRDDNMSWVGFPYGDGTMNATLEDVLSWMGNGPVLVTADSQVKASHKQALENMLEVFQAAYMFDPENIANW